ncbi:MAG: hypothetical protein ACPGDB_04165 [Fusobacterium sp.]
MSDYSTRSIKIVLDGSYIINDNLHIKLNVVKSRVSLPNSSKIEIFNISEKTFNKLKTDPKIEIYVDDNFLFSGKVINVYNEYKAPDWLCTIFASDILTKPYLKPQYIDIKKGTTNKEVLELISSPLSNLKIDASAFANCAKAKGSLLKNMVVEYKKEQDLIKAIQNQFKNCLSDPLDPIISKNGGVEVYKEDGVVKVRKAGKEGITNLKNLIEFEYLLEAPEISSTDIIISLPLTSEDQKRNAGVKAKLGLGFTVTSKSLQRKLITPYVYKNQFEDRIYKIIEFTHEVDNFSSNVAKTTIKGLNCGKK